MGQESRVKGLKSGCCIWDGLASGDAATHDARFTGGGMLYGLKGQRVWSQKSRVMVLQFGQFGAR